jgi:hypothetical protein
MELKAKYSPLSLYEVSTKFKVIVLNRCYNASILSIPIKDVTILIDRVPEIPIL